MLCLPSLLTILYPSLIQVIVAPGYPWWRKGWESCTASFSWKPGIPQPIFCWSNAKRKSVYIFLNCSLTSILPTGWPFHLGYGHCKLIRCFNSQLKYNSRVTWFDTFCGCFQNVYNKADNILSSAFSKWEVILFRSDCLDQVWAQVLSDPFLRRLILR